MKPTNAAEAVANGAQWLDQNHSGWWREIDLETLDIESCRACVCGQLARTAYAQSDYMYLYYQDLIRYSPNRGFDDVWGKWTFGELDEEWHKVIRARLEADALETSGQKLVEVVLT